MRKYLTEHEIETLLSATKLTTDPVRNQTIILLSYRHGLRVSEAAALEWADVSLETSEIWIRRVKNSKSGIHPLNGDEVRLLRKLRRLHPHSRWLFTLKDGTPLKPEALSAMVKRLGIVALPDLNVHFHMLRHSCGYYLANKGTPTRTIQEYLGHRNIQNTQIYTSLNANQFRSLWD